MSSSSSARPIYHKNIYKEAWIIDYDPNFIRWTEPQQYCTQNCCPANSSWTSSLHYHHNDVIFVEPCLSSNPKLWSSSATYHVGQIIKTAYYTNNLYCSSGSSQMPGGGGGGGGGGSNNPVFYHPMTDCSTQASIWAQSASSSLSSGIAVSYGTAPPYRCAVLNGGNPSATGLHLNHRTIAYEHNDCCDCNASWICRSANWNTHGGIGHFTLQISNGYPSYDANGLAIEFDVQIAPQTGVPSDYKIFENTKVTVETALGGRAVETILLSDFGVVTDTYPSGVQGTITHAWTTAGCFDAGSETLTYRLKVECGSISTGSWVSCKTTYTDWDSLSINHITGYGGSGNKQCTPLYEVNHCVGGGTSIIDDINGLGIAANDFVSFSVGGVNICGIVSQVHTGSQARVATVDHAGYQDCAACIVSNPLTGQGGTP